MQQQSQQNRKWQNLILAVLILSVVLALGIVAAGHAAEKPGAINPQVTVGLGLVSPFDLGYLEALEGADTRTYGWLQLANPVRGPVVLQVRLEQVIQRLPSGHRPGTVARVEVGLRF